MLLPVYVSADFVVQLNDINTLNPLDAVNVTLYNGTGVYGGCVSDVLGMCVFNSSFVLPFMVNSTKHGYFDYGVNVSSGSIVNVYMIPISSTGIIRIHTMNLGLHSSDKFCIYFSENMRIKECATVGNGTITLLVNKNFTFVPDLSNSDIMSGSTNIQKYGYLFVPALESLGFLIAICAIIWYFVFKNHNVKYRGKSKR